MKLEKKYYDDQVVEEKEEQKEEKYSSKLNEQTQPSTSSNQHQSHHNKNNELCPICLSSILNQTLARPVQCEHYFCLECIQEWSKVSIFYFTFA